jgi:hypothetical protein
MTLFFQIEYRSLGSVGRILPRSLWACNCAEPDFYYRDQTHFGSNRSSLRQKNWARIASSVPDSIKSRLAKARHAERDARPGFFGGVVHVALRRP